jgi:NAD(P)-dependent dehydrogenase (short-subunit alcohol dehydrogenase family)
MSRGRELRLYRAIGYGASKAAVNMLTVQLAAELKDTGIKVNSADPRYTATALNGHRRVCPDWLVTLSRIWALKFSRRTNATVKDAVTKMKRRLKVQRIAISTVGLLPFVISALLPIGIL